MTTGAGIGMVRPFEPSSSDTFTVQKRSLPAAIALALLSFAAQAQTQAPPNIGDVFRQVQPPALPPAPEPALPNIGNLPVQPPMQALPGGGKQVQVDRLEIVGNREIDTQALQALVSPEEGKRLSLAQLEQLAEKVTRYYRVRGYFVARCYVPAQEITGGQVQLRVVEGNYGQFILENKSRVRNDIVQGLLDDVKHYDIVSLDTLERAMLIINDTPGVQVTRADVMPGDKVGTSDFAIGTEATPAYNGFALLDNYGSVYTGKTRLSAHADWNSPTGRGDRLSLTGLVTDGAGLLNGRLGYSTLVAPNGMRVEAAIAHTRYELGDRYAPLGATGTADSLELNLTKPLQRTRARSLEGGFGFAVRNLRDDISTPSTETPKRSYSVNASLRMRNESVLLGLDGATQASAVVTVGHLGFREDIAKMLDAIGAQTQGNYAKLNVDYSRISALPASFSLSVSARAQATLSSHNLDGSERMSVSGPDGVQAYPTGELSGDHAALARIELTHPLAVSGPARFTASAFTDYGWGKARRPTTSPAAETNDGGRTLGEIGVGVTATLPQGGLAKLQLAHRTVGGPPVSESAARTRLLLQAGWIF